jgi:hypothetical protein
LNVFSRKYNEEEEEEEEEEKLAADFEACFFLDNKKLI